MFGELSVEVAIEATLDRVWCSLVDEIDGWWPAEFYAGGDEGKRRFVLDAVPGGRMFEEWETGGGLLWATVVTVEPRTKLQVVGHAFPEWGGPGIWMGTWELEERGADVLLRFSESTIGKVSEAGVQSKRKGWTYLFEGVLCAYIEGRPIPPWTD